MPADAPSQVTRTRSGEAATFLEAVSEALWEEMERDERVFLMGEDIGAYGGAFKVTRGFLDRFGPSRVIDTPSRRGDSPGLRRGPRTWASDPSWRCSSWTSSPRPMTS